MRIALIVISLVLLGCGHALVRAANVNPATPAIPLRGTLYRATQQDHTVWLFGTVHVGQASFYPLEPIVMRALAEADQLVLELDPTDQPALQAAFARHATLVPPQTIGQVLSTETQRQLQQVLDRLGVMPSAVAGMQPWAIANLLLATTLERSGYAREQGIETYLQQHAPGKPVVALESADYQLGLFDELDATQQEQYLLECLESLLNGKSAQQAATMMDAWGRADGAALQRLIEEELAESTVTAHFTRRVLLDQRNPRLAASIARLGQHGTTQFVAIGLLHLTGPDSVPSLLARRGYRVEKIY
ncbi:TraB/GumN family protein [Actimicrobium sp. CCI2.3]|uniref:TraB/GumN family protein n=1 Tax=Actimicrobium sp. CCI2.3 TaxID=3048616 RepID=UPI002AB48738|nr:TraB/GumN family protein [Actimicrobium sp. CCI2.3]MDY7576408.1 TraB/GumN family protein [Actimicrobium sp. CCI2.3]MEB0024075.1 TraB/GumN family protein [Actimicrobium sp. CCI2.3]